MRGVPPIPGTRVITVFCKDGQTYDVSITVPWEIWMQYFIAWRGVLFDHGWLPMDMVKLIAPTVPKGEAPKLDGNIVPFKK